MKICPRCQKSYTDDGLNFCLDDGATLMQSNAADNSIPATVLLNQTRPTSPTEQFGSQSGGQTGWNAPNQFSMQPPPVKNSKSWLWIVGILGGLVLLCGGGLTGIVFWAASLDNTNRNYNTSYNYNSNRSTLTDKTTTQKIDLSRWVDIDTSGVGNTSYENGEFIMSSKDKRYYYVLVSTNKYQTEDATTKVTVRNTEEADTSLGFGLIFHSNPTPLIQDYAFLIDSENKKYRIVRHAPQDEIVVTKWTYSSAIKDGTQPNVLEIRDKNKKMGFYINSQLITTIDNTNGYSGGVPGLYSSNAVPIAFSNFEITK